MSEKLPVFDFSLLPKDAARIAGAFRQNNIPFWLVGGYVRDWLGGKTSIDVDMVAAADKWTVGRLAHGKIINCRHTIVTVGDVQITPLDQEPFSLEDRDFTANALAIDWNGQLIDPYNGLRDIELRQFRAMSKASLREDPIRMLRGCRLAARLGWKLETETVEWMRELADSLDFLSQRSLRVRMGLELFKALGDEKPSRFLCLVQTMKLMRHLFPQLGKLMAEKPTAAKKRLTALDNTPANDPSRRMAALLADIDPGNPYNSAGIARKYLKTIQWDLLARNIRQPAKFFRRSAIVAAIRFRQTDFRGKNSLARVFNFAKEMDGFNFAEMMRARHLFFGSPANTEFVEAAVAHFQRMGANKNLSRGKRRMGLILSGLSIGEADRIVRPPVAK